MAALLDVLGEDEGQVVPLVRDEVFGTFKPHHGGERGGGVDLRLHHI